MEKVVQQLRLPTRPPLPVVAHEKVQYHRAPQGRARAGLLRIEGESHRDAGAQRAPPLVNGCQCSKEIEREGIIQASKKYKRVVYIMQTGCMVLVVVSAINQIIGSLKLQCF